MVDLETMTVMFDRGHAISPPDQFPDHFFDQGRFPGIGFTHH
jgi:hypothetical protein